MRIIIVTAMICVLLNGCNKTQQSQQDLNADALEEICFLPEDVCQKCQDAGEIDRINVRSPDGSHGSIEKQVVCDAIKHGWKLFHEVAIRLVNLDTREVVLIWPEDVDSYVKKGFIRDRLETRRNKYGEEYHEWLSECVKDNSCVEMKKFKRNPSSSPIDPEFLKKFNLK